MRYLMVLCGLLLQVVISAQVSSADLKKLRSIDDSLSKTGATMLDAPVVTDRMRADSLFTRQLVRALVIRNSFHFSFDSMRMAPVLYAPDSSFRIITWHIPMDGDIFRQKGTLQMRTDDGSLKMFPLFDVSDYSEQPQDSIRTPNNWIGAVYYNMVQHNINNKPVYTLLGYDENSPATTRKWVEVLWFTEDGQPRFGGDFFSIKNDSIFPPTAQRYLLEYKKEGRARLTYDVDDSLIVMDHLVSETNEPEKKYTLIPGGDYQALKWKNNKWDYIDKLFMDVLEDGKEPSPMKILGDDGLADEDALMKQSEKNIEKAQEKEAKAGKPNTPKKQPPKKLPVKN